MNNVKLTDTTPVGNGFDYYNRSLECVINDVKELKALLSYKNISMLKLNKMRALTDIKLTTDALKELEKVLEEL